jgi:iron complex outermembrane recepter protein
MTVRNSRSPKPHRLSAAVLAAMLMPAATSTFAQQAEEPLQRSTATTLDKVVVTGSLIPQTTKETFTPVTVISAEDIQARGFTSVSDVLQQSAFATGGIQGSQSSASFTQGAETVSMFGLNPGFTKYLINGRPMADYPALYNGSDTFNNISGIPVDLVERIEILPGGQSSLYGSDAIAGVVNIILKTRVDNTTISVRGGTYTDGGGDSGRVTLATGFSAMDDRLNGVFGVQYESSEPIWAYQRDITKQYYRNGTSAPLASRDWLVYSPFTSYAFLDPNNCANVTEAFGGSEGLQTRPGFGDENYCGSFFTPGYRTLKNGKDSLQVYSHATFDLNDNHQLYADVLYNDEEVKYHVGSNYTWWGTGVEWGYYYDPDLDDLLNLQRAFAPEEMGVGGFENSMNKDKTESWHITFGAKGRIGSSKWDYDVGLTSTRYELDERGFARFAGPINDYFQNKVLGPQLGLDPYYGAYPVFQPDYAAFYTMMSPEDFRSFTGYTSSKSKTTNDMLRGQLTNSELFSLPGGSAGLAVALEAGQEEWSYRPDARLLNGEVWGTTSVDGGGERDRYAAIAELRLPVFDPLTVSLSGRYDRFEPDGAETVDKTTYSLGIEYRPVESFLLRGKYGTAFKAPTLADQFQAESGYYNFVTDYYNCQLLGFDPTEVDQCPAAFSNRQFFGTTEGSRDLEPLNADVWNVGFVWAPLSTLSFTADYFRWDILDEVGSQDPDGLALREMYCRTGASGYDINSPVCVDALSKITRDGLNRITEIYTPKVNEAQEILEAVNVSVNYVWDTGTYGQLMFRGSYTNNLKHEFVAFEGDDPVDLLRNPGWSSDPKSKANASVTWRKDNWSTTLYANRIGHTPNYRARLLETYDDPTEQAGKLKPFTTYNFSVSYSPLDALALSLSVNNLLNDMPPEDRTYPGTTGEPYNSDQYSAYGRAVYVEARYMFGAK